MDCFSRPGVSAPSQGVDSQLVLAGVGRHVDSPGTTSGDESDAVAGDESPLGFGGGSLRAASPAVTSGSGNVARGISGALVSEKHRGRR